MKYPGQVNFRIDSEVKRKLEALSAAHNWSMSEEVRALVLREYETITDTVRVGITGTVISETGLIVNKGE